MIDVNKKLIFWNKLGSTEEINSSEIGNNGTISGSVTYEACQYGEGINCSSGAYSGHSFHFNADIGTIELWWKPTTELGDTTSCFWGIRNLSSSTNLFACLPVAGDSFFMWVPTNTSTSSWIKFNFPVGTFIGTPTHVAWAWDNSSSSRIRMFVNGEELTVKATNNWNNSTGTLAGSGLETLTIGARESSADISNGPIDNLKAYNYAKTDFSDRFIESPITINGTNIQVDVNKKLILWNKLGSTEEVEKSELGVNGVEYNTVGYEPCNFNNGAEFLASSDRIQFNGFDTNSREFTIDFWFIIPTTTTTNTRVHLFRTETNQPSCFVYVYVDLRSGFLNEIGLYVYPNYIDSVHITTWIQGRLGPNPDPITKGVPYHCRIIVDPDNATLADRGRLYFNGTRINTSVPNNNTTTESDWENSYSLKTAYPGGDGSAGLDGDRIIEDLKVWNYINEDFSTIDIQYPVTANGTNLFITPTRQLVLWNTLGSVEEVNNSEIGLSGTVSGTVSYSSGKFNNCAYFNTSGTSNYISFPILKDFTSGTLEFWWNSDFAWDDTVPNGFATFYRLGGNGLDPFFDYKDTDHEFRVFFRNPSNTAWVQIHYPNNSFLSGTWYHIAIVWDDTGIDGTSEVQRFYFDGIKQTPNPIVGDENSNILTSSLEASPFLALGNPVNADRYLDGKMDNIKYSNYAKTDFSDRFIESPINYKEIITK